jgi:hypothetical protein
MGDVRRRKARQAVWLHRGLAIFFIALTVPGVVWWSQSVLFVILLSLATQISTEFGSAAASNDSAVTDRLDQLLKRRGRDGRRAGFPVGASSRGPGNGTTPRRIRVSS